MSVRLLQSSGLGRHRVLTGGKAPWGAVWRCKERGFEVSAQAVVAFLIPYLLSTMVSILSAMVPMALIRMLFNCGFTAACFSPNWADVMQKRSSSCATDQMVRDVTAMIGRPATLTGGLWPGLATGTGPRVVALGPTSGCKTRRIGSGPTTARDTRYSTLCFTQRNPKRVSNKGWPQSYLASSKPQAVTQKLGDKLQSRGSDGDQEGSALRETTCQSRTILTNVRNCPPFFETFPVEAQCARTPHKNLTYLRVAGDRRTTEIAHAQPQYAATLTPTRHPDCSEYLVFRCLPIFGLVFCHRRQLDGPSRTSGRACHIGRTLRGILGGARCRRPLMYVLLVLPPVDQTIKGFHCSKPLTWEVLEWACVLRTQPIPPLERLGLMRVGRGGRYSKARQAPKEAFRKDVNCRASVRFLESSLARLCHYDHSGFVPLNCRQGLYHPIQNIDIKMRSTWSISLMEENNKPHPKPQPDPPVPVPDNPDDRRRS
ncbi:uncharacterized protein CLUP02_01471 [Colletotrichum lupini]|uniref:Uncharacterized protein n=1 Tax=Colletotrichum lupini TaxID=145971 RepID=A0A9Q8SCP8_9PEZI|nr:uncharacterized protein CLUP02_01471 [Colletotrichum lupini]UQC74819.1 hypothetical protein CLUP02_01471 [Colletotrichum lupini]